jgi:thioredoxin-like negative regulator of GroEL
LPEGTTLADVLGETPKGAVVLCFYANWCTPCVLAKSTLNRIINERKRKPTEAKPAMIRINIDKHQDLASEYKVFSIPCIILLKDGHPVEYMRSVNNLREDFTDIVYKAELIGFA